MSSGADALPPVRAHDADAARKGWQRAVAAIDLLMAAPSALRGVVLRGAHGPVRDALLARVAEHRRVQRVAAGSADWNADDDIDIGASLAAGRPVRQAGPLSRLRNDDALLLVGAERLPLASVNRLCRWLDEHDPGTPVVALDESDAADGDGPPGLTDSALGERLALHVEIPGLTLSELRALQSQPSTASNGDASEPHVPEEIVRDLVALSQALGIVSARAPLAALAAARVAARRAGRDTVTLDDAAVAAALVLAPRARHAAEASEPAPPRDETTDAPDASPEDIADTTDRAPPADPSDAVTDAPPPAEQPIADVLIEATTAALPPHVLGALSAGFSRSGSSAARAGALGAASASRGRPAGVARARAGDRRRRLDLVATLKAAAPWQRIRARPDGVCLAVRPTDFRVRRFRSPQRTTTLFVVDASGSAAMHRIGEAKGALEAVLAECYVRRDRVALISFRGTSATLELPPTRSLARARRTLVALPAGGGTPIASGLDLAARVLADVMRGGENAVGILMTDGRANVARDGTGGRARAQADAEDAAFRLRGLGARWLYVDTAPRPRPVSRELAAAMGARYLALPGTGDSVQALPALLS